MEYLIMFLGSFFAGGINTLAGNGSAITLSILTELLHLPANIANATNRVGVLAQAITGSWAFYNSGKLDVKRSRGYIIPTCIGAILGSFSAIWISNEQFRIVYKVMMCVMLVIILVKPEQWLRETDFNKKLNPWLAVPLFVLVGFYGGFLQMGVGLFIMAVMVLGARYSLMEANAFKMLVTGLLTLFAIIVFQWNGVINWRIGLLMAVGQSLGSWLTATYAIRFPGINVWAYRLLVVVVVLAVLEILGAKQFFQYLFYKK